MWPVYLINLDANIERLRNSDRYFTEAGIPYCRLEGVNGWELTQDEIARVYDERENRRRAKYPLVKPQIGLYLSHINAWKRIASGTARGGFIFEDDFAADPVLKDVLQWLSSDEDDWDMVKLFTPNPTSFTLSRRPLGVGHEIVVPYRVPITNLAYGLTREAARRMAATAIPFFRPCDEGHKFFWEHGLKISLVVPPPARIGAEFAETGTASGTRRAASRRQGWRLFGKAARNFTYQLHYQSRLHFYRLKGMIF